MNTIVHIGYPKTATTWFQDCFFPFVENAKYFDKSEVRRCIINQNIQNLNNLEIIKSLEIDNEKHIIFSSEGIIGAINEGWKNGVNAKENAQKIYKLFPDANIVVFLRNQQELITSSYIQNIKNGGTYSINKYLHKRKELFNVEHLEFDKLIEFYINLFGNEKVNVFLYEDFLADRTMFLEEFNLKLNLKIDLKKINMKEVNSRIKMNFVPIMRFANCFSKKNHKKYKLNIIYIPFLTRFIKYYIKISNNTFLDGGIASSDKVLGLKNIEYIHNYYSSTNQNLSKYISLEKLKLYKYL